MAGYEDPRVLTSLCSFFLLPLNNVAVAFLPLLDIYPIIRRHIRTRGDLASLHAW